MRCFVTGASGLLGTPLVQALTAAGHEVLALYRSSPSSAPATRWIRGELTRPGSWLGALDGCDAVFHLAATHREFVRGEADRAQLESVNVHATASLFRRLTASGQGRFIYVSSAGVVRSTLSHPATSESPEDGTSNDYFRSKVRAEQALRQADGSPGGRLTIVRPSMMLGPDDRGPTPAGAFIRSYLRRELRVVPPVRLVISDARDVARALSRTLHLPTTGTDATAPLLLGGHGLSFGELVSQLQRIAPTSRPPRQPPYWLFAVLARLASVGSMLRGTGVIRSAAELARQRTLAPPDDSRARRLLGYAPRPLEVTLRDTIEWFTQHGLPAPPPPALGPNVPSP